MAVAIDLSFELHEDMSSKIAEEFSPAGISKKLAEVSRGKAPQEIETAGEHLFTEYDEA